MDKLLISRKYLCQLLNVSLSGLWRKLKKYDQELSEAGIKVPLQIARILTKQGIARHNIATKKSQCFFNFKGGTGKTTLTYNISALFYLLGYKILVIDCDPQAHLTKCFIEPNNQENLSIFDVLCKSQEINKVILSIMPEFDLIPANVKLSFVDSQIVNEVRREEILKSLVDPIRDQYDFIFFDVNPSLSVLNRNVIVACDYVNIVCEAQPFSLAGMEMLLQEFNQLARISKDSKVNYNVIVNKFEPNLLSNLEVINVLRETKELETNIFENIIRKCDDFNFSSKNRIPVPFIVNKNTSNAKHDIMHLAKELLQKSCEANKYSQGGNRAS